ncbi:MAG: ankyrin repeat-containing protein, partial [bacterium]
AQNKTGWTALMFAAGWGQTDTIDALLNAGADINIKSRFGWTALTFATKNSQTSTMQKLLESGADPNTSLIWGLTPLMVAAMEGNVATVKTLILAGVNVNTSMSSTGQTALMFAARAGKKDNVLALIGSNADINARDLRGSTPLKEAMQGFNTEVFQILINAGAQ